MPQCAMAQVGSAVAISRNAFSDAVYAKECSKATARSKSCATLGAHEVTKDTVPSFSGTGCECTSSAETLGAQMTALSATSARTGLIDLTPTATENPANP